MMRAILVEGAPFGGEGDRVYHLIAEDTGELLASHVCSSPVYAMGDLWTHRAERRAELERRGYTEAVWLQDSGIDEDELVARNHAFVAADERARAYEAAE